ncbi:uncharacterized protein LOC130331568 [Hyla sarda]|uniref:uncharacterized protein LOC130331568 n=1 Tax=Hyla sarda TaxID=327740 RepID=UPI0024C3E5EC|nr:uncharacterized protein LOC130331568 [Hyla sarda]
MIRQKDIDCVRKEIGTQTEPEMAACQPKSSEDPEPQPIPAMINDLDTKEERERQERNQGEEEEQKEEENGATATVSEKDKCSAEDMRKPSELESILRIAEPAFKSALYKAENEDELSENENVTIVNYLECLVVLRKLQRPGVVQNLTVDEWERRIPHRGTHVVIPVQEHKMAANPLAVLVLTVEEETWFDIYINRVRPTFLQGKNEIQNFFISSSGEKIHNVSQDIARFHYKFGLKSVTSEMVRRNAETFVFSKCKDINERNIFIKYLSQSNHTAERVYREKIMDDTVKASETPMLHESKDNPTTSKTEAVEKPTTSPVIRSKKDEFEKFIEKYPVNVETDPPPHKICLAESAVHGQHLYDRWRKLQNRMRVQYIIGLLQNDRPSEDRVRKCIGLQLWENNLPRVRDILQQWKKK